MSKYYDSGPFKIDQWNTLISDINDKLENPPDGCSPLPPIDEVSAPHIWSVADVEEVRDKMIETCPDISFSAETEIWHYEIIDEIESQIDDMWCDCEECEYQEVEVAVEQVGWTSIDSCPTAARCGVVTSGTSYYCVGQFWAMDTYSGTWYPPLEGANVEYWNKICSTYTDALAKQLEFILAVNTAQQKACQLEKEQEVLDDEILPDLDAAIAEYLSLGCDGEPPPEIATTCSALLDEICSLGAEAQSQQSVIDDKYDEYMVEYNKIDPARTACDSLAAENMAACLAIQTRFPVEWQGMLWALPLITSLEFDWWKWFNPKTDSIISDYNRAFANNDDYFCEPAVTSPTAECAYNSKGCLRYSGHTGCGVRPSVTIMVYSSAYARNVAELKIRLSPNGTPFLSYTYADRLLLDQTIRFFEVDTVHRCDAPPPSCDDPCDFGPETTKLWTWYGGDLEDEVCTGLRGCYEDTWCGFVFSGVVDEVTVPSSYFRYTLSYEAITTRIGKDYTEDRDEFYFDNENWFENHPKYDDRHEDYC